LKKYEVIRREIEDEIDDSKSNERPKIGFWPK
jgi:hypothetical protein